MCRCTVTLWHCYKYCLRYKQLIFLNGSFRSWYFHGGGLKATNRSEGLVENDCHLFPIAVYPALSGAGRSSTQLSQCKGPWAGCQVVTGRTSRDDRGFTPTPAASSSVAAFLDCSSQDKSDSCHISTKYGSFMWIRLKNHLKKVSKLFSHFGNFSEI